MVENISPLVTESAFPYICPLSGLPTFQRPEWVNVTFAPDYQTSVFFLGDKILVTRPVGYPRYPEIKTALSFTRRISDKYIPKNQPYIQIEDYEKLVGVSLEARRRFISDMIQRDRIQALIFCNVDPVFKLIYQLARRLPFVQKRVYLVDTYPDALQLAFSILDKHDLSPSHRPFMPHIKPKDTRPKMKYPLAVENEIRKYVDELVVFLTSINWWTQDEIPADDRYVMDATHPFYPVYAAVTQIKGELDDLFQAHSEAINALKESEKELKEKAIKLEEVNIALKVLLQQRDEVKKELERNVIANFNELVFPSLLQLKSGIKDPKQKAHLDYLAATLDTVFSPFARKLTSKYHKLTATEIKVANLIKLGKRTNDIAEALDLSYKTVETHRMNIRKKLGLTNTKSNLRMYLQSL